MFWSFSAFKTPLDEKANEVNFVWSFLAFKLKKEAPLDEQANGVIFVLVILGVLIEQNTPPPHPTPPSQVAFQTKPTTQAVPAQDLAAGAASGNPIGNPVGNPVDNMK